MAKFKVGDRVEYTGRDALIYGKTGSVGTVKYVDNVIFGGKLPLYEVEFPESPGDTDTISEERLRLANSRACNAKFKVGDVLRDLHHSGIGEVKRVIESDGKILYDLGHGKVVSEDLLIKRGAILSNSVRSRNAVVAKALNACARNGGAENHIGKRFGNVEVSAWDFNGNRHFDFGLGNPSNEPSRAVGEVGSKEYAISKAEESLKRHRQNIADIEKGIAWLKAAK